MNDEFKSALDLTSLGMLVIDKDRTIVWVNPSARSMLSLPPDAIGRDLLDILPPWRALFDAVSGEGLSAFSLELPGTKPDPVSVDVPLPDERGSRVIVCRETPGPIAGQDRPSGTELLVRLDSVMARLSHEMRNPLASVLAGLQALERSGSLSSDDSFILKLVIGEARAAIGIIERFTNSLRTGASVVNRVPVDTLLQNSMADLNETARKQEISLGVIPGASDAWVIADEQALTRALEKLVQNALDACEKGGRIDLGWRVLTEVEKQGMFPQFMGQVIALFGRDTGCGLPPHLPERSLFEPFVTTKPSHAGLGLSVARQIVENHGGAVSLHSLLSGGTEFEVFLPLGDRVDCWEVMQQQRSGAEDVYPCEACDVRLGKAREFCWMVKARSDESRQVFAPHACAKCPFFGVFKLVSVLKPSHRS